MNLLQTIEAEHIAALGKDIPDFAAGDTIRVGFKVTEERGRASRTMRASASAAKAALV